MLRPRLSPFAHLAARHLRSSAPILRELFRPATCLRYSLPFSTTRTPDDVTQYPSTSNFTGPKYGHHMLHMFFTCRVCNTRGRKSFTRGAYETGVVLVRCEGCRNRHVIADQLGWFGEKGNIEDILKEKSEKVIRVSDPVKAEGGDFEYTPTKNDKTVS